MEFDKILAADNKGKLLYIGKDLLKSVLRKDTDCPLGYPEGRLEHGDLYIVLVFQSKKLSACQMERIENLCGHEIPSEKHLIIIGSAWNVDSPPLIKPLDDEIRNYGTSSLIDTVYNGCRVKVSLCDDSATGVTININGQKITAYVSRCLPLAVFNQNGIKYFSDGKKVRTESAEDVLEGEPYCGYWDMEKMIAEETYLEDIVRPDVLSALRSMEYPNRSFIMPKNELFIEKLESQVLFPDWNMWEIHTREELMEKIRAEGHIYQEMSKASADNGVNTEVTFGLWGDDKKTQRIRFLLQKASVTNTTILLTGESGTGKTFLAGEIHKNSRRSKKPFVHVNCAAIPYNLIESELFGYDEGAFTGARRGGRGGYFEMAEGGTLFLDEISEIPLSIQGKLLEVMQSKTYFRVGGTKKLTADVRIIAATNRDLKQLVDRRKFREDLFYRINVFPVGLIPLREHKEALYHIALDLLPEICNRLDVRQQVLSIDALAKMKDYDWPGNIRELENILEKACILSNGKVIYPEDIDIKAGQEVEVAATGDLSLKRQREEFEKKVIEATLKLYGGSKVRTAQHLAIGKTSLFQKIKQYGIVDREDEDS